MSKLIKLVTGLSLATIKELTSRDNGIGTNVTDKDGFESLHRMRKTIIQENVDLVLKDKEIELRDRSFLSALTDYNIDSNDYGEMATRLATIIEGELLFVIDKFIPTVNELSSKVDDKLAELGNTNIQNKYTVKYLDNLSIVNLLRDSELSGTYSTPDLGSIGFGFKAIEDYKVLKSYILTGNSIIDSAINELLATQSEDYWLDLYNVVFTNINPYNGYLKGLATVRLERLYDSIFLYLVSRVYVNKVPFVVEGEPTAMKYSLKVLHSYLQAIVSGNIDRLKTMISSNALIITNVDDVITVNRALMKDLDVDTVIGAAIEGLTDYNVIEREQNRLKAVYSNSNELYIIAMNKSIANTIRVIYMEVYDSELSKLTGSYDRRNVSEYIYSLSVEELRYTNKVIAKSLLIAQFQENGNIEFILDRMKVYVKMFDKDKADFSAVAEYIALELVTRYIVNIHIVIKG